MNPSSTIDQLKEPDQVMNLSGIQIPECLNPVSGLHSLPHSVSDLAQGKCSISISSCYYHYCSYFFIRYKIPSP